MAPRARSRTSRETRTTPACPIHPISTHSAPAGAVSVSPDRQALPSRGGFGFTGPTTPRRRGGLGFTTAPRAPRMPARVPSRANHEQRLAAHAARFGWSRARHSHARCASGMSLPKQPVSALTRCVARRGSPAWNIPFRRCGRGGRRPPMPGRRRSHHPTRRSGRR